MITIREMNGSFATLDGASDRSWRRVRVALTYEIPGLQFSRAPVWMRSDRQGCFVTQARTFPCGFIPRVYRVLTKAGESVRILRLPVRERPTRSQLLHSTPRSYQRDGGDLLFRQRKVCCEAVTGSGKTVIGIDACRRAGTSVLWMVRSTSLLKQTYKELRRELGEPIGIIRGKRRIIHRVTIAMVPSLMQIHVRDFWGIWRVVIGDEVHGAGSPSWYTCTMRCYNATLRMGLSGTAKTGDVERDMRREAAFGPIKVLIPAKDLAAKGIIAKPTFVVLRPRPMSYPTIEEVRDEVVPEWRNNSRVLVNAGAKMFAWAYRRGITRNAYRNQLTEYVAKHHERRGESVLILTVKIEHGDRLARRIKNADWVHGQHNDQQRESAIRRFRSAAQRRQGVILIASSIFGTGINIKEIDVVIIAAGHQSESMIRQFFGRGYRTTATKKNVTIYDFLDGREKDDRDYLYRHAAARLRVYRKLGFPVIRPRKVDFSWLSPR